MVTPLRCVQPQLAYATEIKSIQLHDSIVRLSQTIVSFTLHYIMLNVDKSKELIIKRLRTITAPRHPLFGIERVDSMNILGVIFQCNLSFTMQVDRLVVRCAQTMYALDTLKHHGLSGPPLWEVT